MKGGQIIWVICILLLSSCTKDNFIKTGISNGRFDGSLLEYLDHPGHSYDWDSTVVMVKHVGEDIVRLFEGKDPNHPEITFLGVTNHTIRRYLLQKKLTRVADLDPEWCKKLLLCHILDGKIYRDGIPEGENGTGGTIMEGGAFYTTLGGTRLAIYTEKGLYQGVDKVGPQKIYIKSTHTLQSLEVASSNIEPDNSVVHSLVYYYEWKNMHNDFR